MEDRIKELISKGTSAGYNEVQIIDALRSIGANDSQIKEAQDLFKKKSLSDSTESDFQSQEPPSVSESLSSEYIPKGTSPEFYDRQQQEIANSAAADLYTGIASSKLNFREVVQNPKFEENYRVYKSLSNDPIAKLLPSDPLDESGEIKESVMPTLKRGAISFVNDYLDKEQKKQEERGKERYTVPVISELASGAEAVLGGVFKFAESLGAKTGEIGDLLLDDSGKRAEDALIEYGLSDEELSQGFIENFQDGNIKAGFAQLGLAL